MFVWVMIAVFWLLISFYGCFMLVFGCFCFVLLVAWCFGCLVLVVYLVVGVCWVLVLSLVVWWFVGFVVGFCGSLCLI